MTLKEKVAKVFDMNIDAINVRKRMRDFVIPRQVYAYLLEKYTTADRNTIGAHINPDDPFDRNTIRHSVEAIKGLIYSDRHFAEVIWEIEDEIDNIELPFDRLPKETVKGITKDPFYKYSPEERYIIQLT